LSCILTFFSVIMLLVPAFSHAQEIRLIVRGDDMGMTQGSLLAFEKAFTEGVLTSASIQVPAPWFEGAAQLARRNPSWCTGVHLTLVGEWRGYRWRPVLPWGNVRTLVDEDGFLYRYPGELWAHKPRLGEINAELRAQVNLAIKKGLQVDYLDMHYASPSDYEGLDSIIKKIGRDYNLPISGMLGEKRLPGIYTAPVDKKTQLAVKMLEELTPGLWLWVTHPGIESPEQSALVHTKPEDVFTDGGVGQHRAAETKALISAEVKSVIQKRGIKLTTYRELWRERQKRGGWQR
jgi:predicted glycoside hydrolase/deacetylase ChbG (UPF0249 family)